MQLKVCELILERNALYQRLKEYKMAGKKMSCAPMPKGSGKMSSKPMSKSAGTSNMNAGGSNRVGSGTKKLGKGK